MSKNKKLKVGIFIIAYNAAQTLISAYKRIPATLKHRAKEIYCFDDCSDDNTYYAGLGYKTANKIKNFVLYKNPKNLGYGGNQKKGYRYAIKKNFDVVVMLHGDAQYAPEKMPLLLEPFYKNAGENIGVVMGSRMLGDPLKGGMPLYKYLGNKVLTRLENIILGSNLSEFHSGYRAYNLHALKNIPFEKCSSDFHFDTEILIMLLKAKYKIVEVSIPTYYGPGAKSHVNVFKYGIDCLSSSLEYKLHELGIKRKSKFSFRLIDPHSYSFKSDLKSSHVQISDWIKKLECKNILDLGCSEGFLVRALGKKWKGRLVGLEKDNFFQEHKYLVDYDKVIQHDLDSEQEPKDLDGEKFDAIVAGDILEHLKKPNQTLKLIKKHMATDSYLIVSLPNTRFLPVVILRKLFPKFKMSKGPLDWSHKYYFNFKSASKLLVKNGFTIETIFTSPPPISLIHSSFGKNKPLHFIYQFLFMLSRLFPSTFSYQILLLARLEK